VYNLIDINYVICEIVRAMTEVVYTYTSSVCGVSARNAQNKTSGNEKKNCKCETDL